MSSTTEFSPVELGNDPAAPGDPFLRTRYHYGMLLGADDFTVDQKHHILRHRLHQALLHGHGTVSGLRVTRYTADAGAIEELRIRPGLAIDVQGRDLYVAKELCLDVVPLSDAAWASFEQVDPADALPFLQDPADDGTGVRRAYVVLQYVACQAQPVPAVTPPCGDPSESFAYSRIVDSYRADLVAEAPALPWYLQDQVPGSPYVPALAGMLVPPSPEGLREVVLRIILDLPHAVSTIWNSAPEAPVLLATAYLRRDALNRTSVVGVDNGVRPLVPQVQLGMGRLLGQSLVVREVDARPCLLEATVLPPDSGDVDNAFYVQLTFSAEVVLETVRQGTQMVRLQPSGWDGTVLLDFEVDLGDPRIVRVLVDAAATSGGAWSVATPWRLVLAGTGPTPICTIEGHPFVGRWSDIRPQDHNVGQDAIVSGTYLNSGS